MWRVTVAAASRGCAAACPLERAPLGPQGTPSPTSARIPRDLFHCALPSSPAPERPASASICGMRLRPARSGERRWPARRAGPSGRPAPGAYRRSTGTGKRRRRRCAAGGPPSPAAAPAASAPPLPAERAQPVSWLPHWTPLRATAAQAPRAAAASPPERRRCGSAPSWCAAAGRKPSAVEFRQQTRAASHHIAPSPKGRTLADVSPRHTTWRRAVGRGDPHIGFNLRHG